jgi:PAS domain-containing protein
VVRLRDILISGKAVSIGGRDFIQSIWRDITERKKALEDLQISEANYRTIFDSANDAIFVHDTESGKILSVNRLLTRGVRETYGRGYQHRRTAS